MSTTRSMQMALEAGRCYQVDFAGPHVLRHPVDDRPRQLRYGVEVYWADTPEEAAGYLRTLFPCSDRLAVEVRQIIGVTRGCNNLESVPVQTDGAESEGRL